MREETVVPELALLSPGPEVVLAAFSWGNYPGPRSLNSTTTTMASSSSSFSTYDCFCVFPYCGWSGFLCWPQLSLTTNWSGQTPDTLEIKNPLSPPLILISLIWTPSSSLDLIARLSPELGSHHTLPPLLSIGVCPGFYLTDSGL